ncbi:MAG: 7-cyano-7-deazaguanine synthase QueC [Candidatus Omnitrophica bacterium]|nr:7-cyano-7-deazaguanine synthase QueC [Candidatus Omnitrophota bacterium]
MKKKAIVLLSGGLDSAVTLYIAKKQGFNCHCLVFDYGQRHRKEIESAKKIVKKTGCSCKVLKINLPWGGSSLLGDKVPSTYVPGRNIIFLSFALSYAEAIAARAIFIGAHTQDYSGYPDCRPEFLKAFGAMAGKGTKAGVENSSIVIKAPLLYKRKSEIIKIGAKLNVPFNQTWSCYAGGEKPCGKCDSCYYRRKGFKEAGLIDKALC